MADLIPRDFLSFPRLRFPSLWDELREDLEEMRAGMMVAPRGMSIYKDDKNVFVEVSVPGVDPKKDPDVSYRNGLLVAKFDKSPAIKPKKIPVKTVGLR